MVMKTECDNCHTESKDIQGWWTVTELLRTYSLCHRCYRTRSLQSQKEMIVELIESLNPKHPDDRVAMGMRSMQSEIRQAIKDMKP